MVRKAIEVFGIVQGVGFRPYIYRLAGERQLAGSICNTAAGVSVEVQGPLAAVDDFLSRLLVEAPPLARITGINVREIPCNGDLDFCIVTTHRGEPVNTLISPDVAVCGDCLREMFDPVDRRYRYPFINCTNCGPRFTIVRNIPYDRPFTSMTAFRMCRACQAEYDDPLNRRFHAQPNACWACGPQVELWGLEGKRVEVTDPIAETVARLQRGDAVAIKGLGGFHLACDATNADAVRALRERKRRVEKPFAVMVPDVGAAERFCEVDEAARALLLASQRPIVLLRRQEGSAIADEVAPFNCYLGVFLPYTPLHHLLFAEGRFSALVMTSANMSEEPICIANDEAVLRLQKLADCFLVHNRDILLRCDDSVTRVCSGRSRQLRRSRGFVPVPVFLSEDVPSVLAVGGELKNTICLTNGRHAFLSQHIGDLENTCLDGLDLVAHPRHEHHENRVGVVDDVHFLLARADGLHDDDVLAQDVHHVDGIPHGLGQAAQGPARGETPDENSRVLGVALHTDAVAEDGAPCEGACGVDGQHADGLPFLAEAVDEAVGQRALPRTGRAGDANDMRPPREGEEVLDGELRLRHPILQVADEARGGTDVTALDLLCDFHSGCPYLSSRFHVCVDPGDDRFQLRPGHEDRLQACIIHQLEVLFGDDPAADDHDVVGALVLEKLRDGRIKIAVGARQAAQAQQVHVFLYRRRHDLLGCLVTARVNHFVTGIAETAGQNPGAAVVPVETRLCNHNTQFSLSHDIFPLLPSRVPDRGIRRRLRGRRRRFPARSTGP